MAHSNINSPQRDQQPRRTIHSAGLGMVETSTISPNNAYKAQVETRAKQQQNPSTQNAARRQSESSRSERPPMNTVRYLLCFLCDGTSYQWWFKSSRVAYGVSTVMYNKGAGYIRIERVEMQTIP